MAANKHNLALDPAASASRRVDVRLESKADVATGQATKRPQCPLAYSSEGPRPAQLLLHCPFGAGGQSSLPVDRRLPSKKYSEMSTSNRKTASFGVPRELAYGYVQAVRVNNSTRVRPALPYAGRAASSAGRPGC